MLNPPTSIKVLLYQMHWFYNRTHHMLTYDCPNSFETCLKLTFIKYDSRPVIQYFALYEAGNSIRIR